MKLDSEYASRPVSAAESACLPAEESCVTDARANLTPAQMVERKLVSLLQGTRLPVSRRQGGGPRRPLS
jgi:hypothetical protein